MNPEIQGIVFDFGNVICSVDNGRFLKALGILCGLPPELLHQRIFLGSTLPDDYESGRIDSAGFLAGISKECGTPLSEETLRRAHSQIFTPIESTQSLIRRLKPYYRLGLLSNTNPWHFELGISTTPIFPLFDTVTLSYEVGAMKPSPAIYADALTKLALPPEACVFIDDRPEFTDAAQAMGMRGIPYTGEGELLEAMAGMGIRGLA